jgi:hypothetical protein
MTSRTFVVVLTNVMEGASGFEPPTSFAVSFFFLKRSRIGMVETKCAVFLGGTKRRQGRARYGSAPNSPAASGTFEDCSGSLV